MTLAAPAIDSAPEPAPPSARRRRAGWIAIAAALVVVGIAGAVLSGIGQWSQRNALDPESPGAMGTRALAEVLRDHGVEVIVARDRAAAQDALSAGPATLVLPDAPYLSDDAFVAVTDAATTVVLADPRARTLGLLLPGSATGGLGPGSAVEPACEVAAAQRAGRIAPGAVYTPGDGIRACYAASSVDDAPAYGLLVSDDGSTIAIDGRETFVNENLALDGNAALAVNLLGEHPTLVWYMPTIDDSDLAENDPTLGELTPPWVSPVIALLLVAGVAAAIWRGRRFGPLVTERLAVTVRASETTEGRSRLYAHARDAAHAADQLRIAALDRLASLLGLGAAASPTAIADAAAARTGFDYAAVRATLIDDRPATDAELVDLNDRIRTLERAVRHAVRPEGSPR